MNPKQKPFVVKPLIITSSPDKWFFEDLELVARIYAEMKNVTVLPFRIRHADPVPDVYEGNDGKVRMSHDWFYNEFTKRYMAEGYNLIFYHISKAEKDFYNLHPTINASYWRDTNNVLESWLSADEGQYPPRNRTQMVTDPDTGEEVEINEIQRLLLHEAAHGFIHFSGRREELEHKFDTGRQLVTHYFDYTLRDIGELYRHISFEKWSLMDFITQLLRQLIDLLTLKSELEITQPKPEPEPETPQPSMLVQWAKAIEKFEDYVEPGGTYRDGTSAPNGSLSYRHRNPGNLRWSPYQAGQAKGFAYFNSYQEGFDALLHQLQIAVDGRSSVYSPNMTLLEFFEKYAPSSDNNHPHIYAGFVALQLGVDIDTVISNLA